MSAVATITARQVASQVPDPELPMLTLDDLGILRDVAFDGGTVFVTITPTYSGCPALREMSIDLRNRLVAAGFDRVDIRAVLRPAWTTEWITAEGRRKLAEAGIAPPGSVRSRPGGPVPLTLTPTVRHVTCPLCGSTDTALQSAFSATACKALYRCEACREPFEYVKEI